MLGMRRMVSVTAAQNERAAKGSRASWPPACSHRSVGAGWSVNPMPENPAASAAVQKRVRPAFVTNSGVYGCVVMGYVTQKFMAWTLTFPSDAPQCHGGTCQVVRSSLRARPTRAWPQPPKVVSPVLPA